MSKPTVYRGIPGWSLAKNSDGTVGAVCAAGVGGDIGIKNAGRLEQRLLHNLVTDIVTHFGSQPMPGPGLVDADYSALEARVAANAASDDPLTPLPWTSDLLFAGYQPNGYMIRGADGSPVARTCAQDEATGEANMELIIAAALHPKDCSAEAAEWEAESKLPHEEAMAVIASRRHNHNKTDAAPVAAAPAGSDVCPVTGLPFYDNMEHPERGMIAMYGGPFDVYSIPELQDNDDELRRERYDLDADNWVEGGEPLGYFYSEQQPEAATTPAAPVVDPSRLGAAMKAFDDAGGHAVSYAPAWMRKALEAASTPAAPGIDVLNTAYFQGWVAAAGWADRDDLVADEGSKAYTDERDQRLHGLPDASPKGGSDADDRTWREGWALAYSGAANLYGDDSELQDNSTQPFIDWRRDSVETIRDKITERGNRAIAAMQATSAEVRS